MMILSLKHKRTVFAALAIPAVALAIQCAPSEPRTDAERLARGRQLIQSMSAKLASAGSLSVRTNERSERIRAGGAIQPVALTRVTVVRRPDRLHFRTSGDMEVEGWYDGMGLTIAMPKEKVFAQARMPETLDKTFDTVHERYGIPTPVGDFLYSDPAKALLAETTTGGWVGRETIDGQQTDHLAFKDKGVNWEIWLSTADQLPRKSRADFAENKRIRKPGSVHRRQQLQAERAARLRGNCPRPACQGAEISAGRCHADVRHHQKIVTWRIELCV